MRRSTRRRATALAAGDLPQPARPAVRQARVRALGRRSRRHAALRPLRGLDERVIEARELEEISLGDFVLSGGEPAAMALIDACVRLLPGVIGAAESLDEESFERGPAGISALHAAADGQGARCRRCCCPAITRRSAPGALAQAEQITRDRGGPISGHAYRGKAPTAARRRGRSRVVQPMTKDEHDMNILQTARSRADRQADRRRAVPDFRPGRHACGSTSR